MEDLDSTRIHDTAHNVPDLPDISIVMPSKPPTILVNEVKSPYFTKKVDTKIDEEEPACTTSSSLSSNTNNPNSSSTSSGPRSTRPARNRKPIKISYTDSDVSSEADAFLTDDDDDGEWKGAESLPSESDSDSDDGFWPSSKGRRGTKRATTKETNAVKPTARPKRTATKRSEGQMIFLDLTHAEVAEVDENYDPDNLSGTLARNVPDNTATLHFFFYRRKVG